MKIYFFSGLGADERAFKLLNLPKEFNCVYIKWELPLLNEPIENYAKRISNQINSPESKIFVGLSFGGLIAIEISKFIKPEKIILISSIRSNKELPFYYRLFGILKLNKLVPPKLSNKPNFLTYWLFGIKTKNNKELLKSILIDTNTTFSKWALNVLLNWKCDENEIEPIRIHGSRDLLLPIFNFKPKYLIKNGGHLIIIDQADEISNIIINEIGVR